MRILTYKKIKTLLNRILVCIAVFIVTSLIFMNGTVTHTALYIVVGALCMGLAIWIACYVYFREQHVMIENASEQIMEYISGNQDARIKCNDEGELYSLFHDVNSLVSILNAHAENELRAKEFLKDTISDISHQLKTPLAALNIYNGILQDEAEQSPAVQEFTHLIEQELDRIETLVQILLKMTKLDAGTIIIEKSLENVSEIMESAGKHAAFRATQEEKEICLSGDDSITLLCDRNWLLEAIDNIIKNAFDHTKKGDWIHVEWKQFASVVQIIIKDNGSGIHPEDMYHIFKRFYRSKFSKDTQGIGLGLPLAKSIIEAHKGTIEVDSELGVGTTFIINLLNTTKL